MKKIANIIFAMCAICVFAPLAAFADIDTGFDADHVRLINARRAEMGVPGVMASESLNRAARIRAKEIAQQWGMTRPNGALWSTVLREVVSFDFGACGENIYAGESEVSAVVGRFMSDPVYRVNIMNDRHARVGVATFVVPDGASSSMGHKRFWVEIFAENAPDMPIIPGGGPVAGGVLFGSSHVWRHGSEAPGITIIGARKAASVTEILVDGAAIDAHNYAVGNADAPYSGSAELQIKKIHLDWIKAGRHTGAIVVSDDQPLYFSFSTIRDDVDRSASFDVTPDSWRRGSKTGMKLTARGIDSSMIAGVYMDESALTANVDYAVRSAADGSEVTIQPSVFESLSDGTHTITVAMLDGAAKKTITISEQGGGTGSGGGGGGCEAGTLALLALLAAAASVCKIKRVWTDCGPN